MTGAAILATALVLDAIFGEPKWLWDRLRHPAVLIGSVVGWLDARFNQGHGRKAKGVLALLALIVFAVALGVAIQKLPFSPLWEMLLTAVLLAHRSLVDHVGAVANGLRISVDAGRAEVANIVGRDTAVMDETQIARGAIESGAENFSDGVVAPAFWFLLAGLPGLLAYKVVNTADSMIGYRTPRHREFGWAAARADDLLNWVPARLSALLIALTQLRMDVWRIVRRDASLHRSPNAGWPEAAMAACLNVAIAGPRSYEGVMTDYPLVYPEGRRDLSAEDIEQAVKVLWRAWFGLLAVVVFLAVV